ncbi:MAG: DinB family protein, partial [Planctomycetota bacterium]
DLMRRPHPDCNHLAWQLGHLISSEAQLLEMLQPGAAPPLPPGFHDQYSRDTVADDEPDHFHTKQEYLELFELVRAATHAAIEKVSDADLDSPNPHPDENFRKSFPTIGSMYVLTATHPMMHAGQFVPVRRAVQKPVLI